MVQAKLAYLAGGCFWGLEDLFREQPGVIATEVGYSGGENQNPTYENHPGHAETLAITYDPAKTDFTHLLDFFFRIHDPTTVNRQGNDVGSSYRSAIFYQTDDELKIAKMVIGKVNESGLYKKPVVTSLEKFKAFYTAEAYHQDYLRKHPGGYTCHYVRTDTSLL
ncbi:MAG TPA: peptide-methionine (S)-S-oxide reductase MsrA [Candidatus Saccharimonadales bacterium]|nr:peptide-methionine (S)-S-oxide reductase MsrA [Candidatus Saccharimonadales bacterium]